ncbi:3-oxoacyl-ACP reductase FabG [Xanthobacter dioxanivorans]|uniref:3-oxoacyl-ACP reductase FabG n=1 Tax=Xanthobacter dioxanivorans TaxID=2528964 RepID=A0A974PT82_9HYPH|nr:3-oxoacyl-ACP reductase FabG [Xanthobacter dioxanivorans]QRG09317.1 3-oxoacyl-ACP reductase FabG [Xanthobacter dioxanivorans]
MTSSSIERAPLSLAGRVALVTGAARGIGWSIAQAAAAAGAHVVLNDLEPGPVAARVAELSARGHGASGAAFNVTCEAAVGAAMEEVLARLGAVDILVNNAGVQRRKMFHEFTYDEWRAVVDTHLNGAFLVTRAVVPRMMERRYGRIVMLGSIAARQPKPALAAYAAAKGGVTSLVRALAVELGPHGITCNAIAPGFIATEFTRALQDDEAFTRRMLDRVPGGRWGQPEDLAPAVLYLASPAAAFVNGRVLTIDGGFLAAG